MPIIFPFQRLMSFFKKKQSFFKFPKITRTFCSPADFYPLSPRLSATAGVYHVTSHAAVNIGTPGGTFSLSQPSLASSVPRALCILSLCHIVFPPLFILASRLTPLPSLSLFICVALHSVVLQERKTEETRHTLTHISGLKQLIYPNATEHGCVN